MATRTETPYAALSSLYPERSRLNDTLFTSPTPAALAEAYQGYGVRWLFVDLRDARPPADLDRLAVPVYRTTDAAVFRLRSP